MIIQESTIKHASSYVSEDLEDEILNQIWPKPNSKNADERKLSGSMEVAGGASEVTLQRDALVSEFMDLHCRAGHTSFAKL